MKNRLAKSVIGIIATIIVAGWILLGIIVVKTINHIDENGIKGATERIWCGRNQDCHLPTEENKDIK